MSSPVTPPLPEAEIKARVNALLASRLDAHVKVAVAEVRLKVDAELESLRERVATLSRKLGQIRALSLEEDDFINSEAAVPKDARDEKALPLPAEASASAFEGAPALPSTKASNTTPSLEVPTPAEPVRDELQADTPLVVVEAGPESLSAKERRFLDTLASLHNLGLREVAREVAAPLSGQSHRSSAYTALITDLHKRGLLTYPAPGGLALTEAGRAAATPTPKPLNDAALQGAWLGQLESYEERLARELLNAHPKALSRDELSVLTGYSAASSRFAAALTKLRKFGLVDYPAAGTVAAGANFFLRPRELS